MITSFVAVTTDRLPTIGGSRNLPDDIDLCLPPIFSEHLDIPPAHAETAYADLVVARPFSLPIHGAKDVEELLPHGRIALETDCRQLLLDGFTVSSGGKIEEIHLWALIFASLDSNRGVSSPVGDGVPGIFEWVFPNVPEVRFF